MEKNCLHGFALQGPRRVSDHPSEVEISGDLENIKDLTWTILSKLLLMLWLAWSSV